MKKQKKSNESDSKNQDHKNSSKGEISKDMEDQEKPGLPDIDLKKFMGCGG